MDDGVVLYPWQTTSGWKMKWYIRLGRSLVGRRWGGSLNFQTIKG